MDGLTRTDPDAEVLAQARWVDRECDRFEAAWRAGPRPRLEEYLGDAAEPVRPALLRALLVLDLALRRAGGERPEPPEYRGRFPEHPHLVDAAFASHSESTEAGGGPGTTGADGASCDPADPGAGTLAGDRHAAASGRAASAIPGYEILNELGRGGMGVVYLARQLWLNRPCALKMILAGAHAGPEASLRFLAEAEAVARFQHPNVVQIYHIGEAGGLPYLELEYVPGGSLDRALDGTPWPARRAAELVEALARGMDAAHRLGIVHRDLKPANVLLAADGTPKIADFGLAKALGVDSGLTGTDAVLGSPDYMAPEQAAGRTREAGPAADVYALGAILYELVTGRPPFRGATVLETLEQVKGSEPVPPSRLRPGLPRDVETIALTCLRKEPARRYASAAALAEDLRRFAANEPIRARRTGPVERTSRWCRRNPAVAALIAIVAWWLAVVPMATALFIWPPSAAYLFRKAGELMASKQPDDWYVARHPIPRPARPPVPEPPLQEDDPGLASPDRAHAAQRGVPVQSGREVDGLQAAGRLVRSPRPIPRPARPPVPEPPIQEGDPGLARPDPDHGEARWKLASTLEFP